MPKTFLNTGPSNHPTKKLKKSSPSSNGSQSSSRRSSSRSGSRRNSQSSSRSGSRRSSSRSGSRRSSLRSGSRRNSQNNLIGSSYDSSSISSIGTNIVGSSLISSVGSLSNSNNNNELPLSAAEIVRQHQLRMDELEQELDLELATIAHVARELQREYDERRRIDQINLQIRLAEIEQDRLHGPP